MPVLSIDRRTTRIERLTTRDVCPVCNSHKGKCAKVVNIESGALISVWCFYSESAPGWRKGKALKHGLGYAFYPSDSSRGKGYAARRQHTASQKQLSRWEQRLERLIKLEEEELLAKSETRLASIPERDEGYRVICSCKTLQPEDRQALRNRGLNDFQIKQAFEMGVRSWQANKVLPTAVSPLIAGVNHNGTKTRGGFGLAIPALDPFGHITGYQIAGGGTTRDGAKIPKYYALSSAKPDTEGRVGNGPQLPNGELPLCCWIRPGSTLGYIPEVWLVEGALKSMILALCAWEQGFNVAVIGSWGNHFGEDTLRSYLDFIKPIKIKLFPDAGAVQNPQVTSGYWGALSNLVQWGYEDISIAWWGQEKKGLVPDADELCVTQKLPPERLMKSQVVEFYLGAPSAPMRMMGKIVELRDTYPENRHVKELTLCPIYGDARVADEHRRITITYEQVVGLVSQLASLNAISTDAFYELHAPECKKIIDEKFATTSAPKIYWGNVPAGSPLGMSAAERANIELLETARLRLHLQKYGATLPPAQEYSLLPAARKPVNEDDVPEGPYPQEFRLDRWTKLIGNPESRRRWVLDSSGTGTGKSHSAGMLDPTMFRGYASRIFYVTNDPLNVSVETLKDGWTTLRGRDYGRKTQHVSVTNADGSVTRTTLLRRAERDYEGELAMTANCDRTAIAEVIAQKRIQMNDGDSICKGCPFIASCESGVRRDGRPAEFTYRADRRKALANDRVICHPENLTFDHMEDDESAVVILEEGASMPWTVSYDVPLEDVSQIRLDISYKHLQEFPQYESLLNNLARAMTAVIKLFRDTKPGRFSKWNHSDVMQRIQEEGVDVESLRDFPQVLIDSIIRGQLSEILQRYQEIAEQDLIDIDAIDDTETRRAAHRANRAASNGIKWEIEKRIQELSLRWLPDFIDAVSGKDPDIVLSKNDSGNLLIKKINKPFIEKLKDSRVASVIILDATERKENFSDMLGISPDEMHHIWAATLDELNDIYGTRNPAELAQEGITKIEESADIEFIQVIGLGLLGSSRGSRQQAELKKVKEAIRQREGGNVPVIELKQFLEQGSEDGAWGRESRGSNAYQNARTIMLVGAPIPNVGAMMDEYQILNHYRPSEETVIRRYPYYHERDEERGYCSRGMRESADAGFARFLREKTLSNFEQAIGRLRANRRPGEKLTVYLITEYPTNKPVTLIEAKDLIGESRSPVADRIKRVIEIRQRNGWRMGLKEIAKQAQCSVSYVAMSPEWKAWKSSRERVSGTLPISPADIYINNAPEKCRSTSKPYPEPIPAFADGSSLGNRKIPPLTDDNPRYPSLKEQYPALIRPDQPPEIAQMRLVNTEKLPTVHEQWQPE